MVVRWWWPHCDFQNGHWGEPAQDSFFVECTLEEARQMRPTATGDPPEHPVDVRCFLVSRDLSSIVEFSLRYPYHQLWNAYSPFLLIDPPIVLAQLTDVMAMAP